MDSKYDVSTQKRKANTTISRSDDDLMFNDVKQKKKTSQIWQYLKENEDFYECTICNKKLKK